MGSAGRVVAIMTGAAAAAPSRKQRYACVRCAQRKVKCDRQAPCKACINHDRDCLYQSPKRPGRKPKYEQEHPFIRRLRRYEALLEQHGIDPRGIPDTSAKESVPSDDLQVEAYPREPLPTSVAAQTTGSVSRAQIVHSRKRPMFLENSLWTSISDELQDSEHDSETDTLEHGDLTTRRKDLNVVLNRKSRSEVEAHRSPGRIKYLWQAFVENVDPLTKIIHVPTLRPAIEMTITDTEAPSRAEDALVDAVCSIAVVSLDEDTCRRDLGESRTALLAAYINATEVALSRAQFMETTEPQVLQALALYLLSVQELEKPRTNWCLIGVAIRIAQAMGLDKDGLHLGLSEFDSEIRRRIWWALNTHDHRIADLCGVSKFRDLEIGPYIPKWPSDVNDDQLHPGLTSPAVRTQSLTDAAFVALKYDFVKVAAERVAKLRQLGSHPTEWDQELAQRGGSADMKNMLTEIQEMVETRYLRYCDPSQPLHLMMMLMARAAIGTIEFLANHPRRWPSLQQTPEAERQSVWNVSIKLLEQYVVLKTNPLLKRFAWYAAFVMQWHALIHVLNTLRADPQVRDSEKAWGLIQNIYESTPAILTNLRKPIHAAIGNLCLKAYNARALALHKSTDDNPVPIPDFIARLRHRKSNARTRTAGGAVQGERSEKSLSTGRAREPDATMASASTSSHRKEGSHPNVSIRRNADHSSPVNHLDHADARGWDGDGNTDLDLDLDIELTEWDRFEGDNELGTASWAQWDAWLAEAGAADFSWSYS